MSNTKLKPCPFCGGKIRFKEILESVDCCKIHAVCTVCGMEFLHEQAFAYSNKVRAPIGRSFEGIWNRRLYE